jgi:hypothetical protein
MKDVQEEVRKGKSDEKCKKVCVMILILTRRSDMSRGDGEKQKGWGTTVLLYQKENPTLNSDTISYSRKRHIIRIPSENP